MKNYFFFSMFLIGFLFYWSSTPVAFSSLADDMTCKNQFHVMIIKNADNSPACVSVETFYVLIQRGWASQQSSDVDRAAMMVAKQHVLSDPTFAPGGIEEEGFAVSILQNDDYGVSPHQYLVQVDFDTIQNWYFDGEEQVLTESLFQQHHTVVLDITGSNINSKTTTHGSKISLSNSVTRSGSNIEERLSNLRYDASLKEIEKIYQERDSEPFREFFVTGLKEAYAAGDPISFRVTDAGYGKCVETTLEITKIDDLNNKTTFWQWVIVPSCPDDPKENDGVLFLNYLDFAQSQGYATFPPITEAGTYSISITYGKDTYSKEFAVLLSDHVLDHYLVYSENKNDEKKIQTLTIDLTDGTITVKEGDPRQNMAERSAGNLGTSKLNALNKAIDSSGLLGDISYAYARYHACQSAENSEKPSCTERLEYMVEIFWDNYSQYLRWYDGSPDIREDHIPLIQEMEKISDSYLQ